MVVHFFNTSSTHSKNTKKSMIKLTYPVEAFSLQACLSFVHLPLDFY